MTLIYAHRGASAYAPENTIPAFEKAAGQNADGIEIDIHMTKDGEIVVAHDETVDRVTDGSGRITDMTLDELKSLNFAKRFPEFGKVQIPTLDETLKFIAPTGMRLNIEIKSGIVLYPGIEQKALEIVVKYPMAGKVIYSSFNHYSLKALKAFDPAASIGLLYQTALYEPWRYAHYVGAEAIHPFYPTLLAPGIVPACHELGIAVNAWTVDDPTHLGMLMRLGADIVITNKPDVALSVRSSLS